MTEFRDDDIPLMKKDMKRLTKYTRASVRCLKKKAAFPAENYMKPRGEYYDAYNHLFINKCLLKAMRL